MKQNFFLGDKTRMRNVPLLLEICILFTFLLSGCQFLRNGLQPPPTATETLFIPTLFVPTPDCGTPTLLLGSSTFQIETIQPAVDGTLSVPPDKSGIAYWIDGTNSNYTFVLSPTTENLAILPTLTIGSTAKVTWSDCNSSKYTLSAPEQGSSSAAALPDQTMEGITVFFQTDASGASFIFRGELIEEQISAFNTPVPGDIQAEISLLETTTSPDNGSIRVGVSILNYGTAAFTLSATDVTLTQPDSTPVGMLSSEPPLPKEIAPGRTETIYFFFYRPASPTTTLKLLSVEYELEGY